MIIIYTTAGRNPSEPSIGAFKYIKKTLAYMGDWEEASNVLEKLITHSSVAYPDRKSENIDLKWHIIFDGLNRYI